MIYVFIASGFEEVEALTVVDLLRRAENNVVTVGVGDNIIRGSHGIITVTNITDKELVLDERVEMIVIPGGMPGTLNLEKNPAVQRAIDYCAEKNIYIAAICAAPSILGHKGLLKGRKACCYPGYEQELTGAEVVNDAVVVDGKIITSRGVGTAMSFALKLTELLTSPERSKLLGDSLVCM